MIRGFLLLTVDVLERAQKELINWNHSGMSVMEMSHRGPQYMEIQAQAEKNLRELMGIPDNYKVLFLQGGASTQFAAIPLNLTKPGDKMDIVSWVTPWQPCRRGLLSSLFAPRPAPQLVTGSWSKKAQEEAHKMGCDVNVVAKGDNKSIPPQSTWKLSEAKYLALCSNETIQGVEFKHDPEVQGKILIADMSSNIMSKPVDVSKYGVIYAGAQKNVGPAGVTIVIVREDLIGHCRTDAPTMLDWKTAADNDSMYNTPPCYSIYLCGLVFEKLLKEGGLKEMERKNNAKAKLIYDAIEHCKGFYDCPVRHDVRSNMNIPFTIPAKPELEKVFIKEAEKLGMIQLAGHRSVGGMRASVYNAMPKEGCQALADFMVEFYKKHSA